MCIRDSAHPRSLAVTNDGDTVDGDETVFVTEFFGQPRLDAPAGTLGVDIAREGLVYRFNAGSGVLAPPVALPPPEDSGFVEACPLYPSDPADQKNG